MRYCMNFYPGVYISTLFRNFRYGTVFKFWLFSEKFFCGTKNFSKEWKKFRKNLTILQGMKKNSKKIWKYSICMEYFFHISGFFFHSLENCQNFSDFSFIPWKSFMFNRKTFPYKILHSVKGCVIFVLKGCVIFAV